MSASEFVYVSFIRSTPAKVWNALLTPEITKKIWLGAHLEADDWKKGSAWRLMLPDRLADSGEIIEIIPERKLVLTWRNEFRPELKAEGFSRMTLEIEPSGNAVKLTIAHEIDVPDSKLIKAVNGGWPKIISNLKSLLETGEVIPEIADWNAGCPGANH